MPSHNYIQSCIHPHIHAYTHTYIQPMDTHTYHQVPLSWRGLGRVSRFQHWPMAFTTRHEPDASSNPCVFRATPCVDRGRVGRRSPRACPLPRRCPPRGYLWHRITHVAPQYSEWRGHSPGTTLAARYRAHRWLPDASPASQRRPCTTPRCSSTSLARVSRLGCSRGRMTRTPLRAKSKRVNCLQ